MKNIDKKTILAILLVIVAILTIIFSNINKSKEENDNSILMVTNHNDFYTVDSCIYRTITYINNENYDDLNLVLSENYKGKNSKNIFGELPENATFISKKMYNQTVTSNITKYYVYGIVEENKLIEDSTDTKEKKIYILLFI